MLSTESHFLKRTFSHVNLVYIEFKNSSLVGVKFSSMSLVMMRHIDSSFHNALMQVSSTVNPTKFGNFRHGTSVDTLTLKTAGVSLHLEG